MELPTLVFEKDVYCRYCQKPIREGPANRFSRGAAYAHIKCSMEEDFDSAFMNADVINIKYASSLEEEE